MPDMKTLTINGVQYNIVDPNATPASHAEDKNNPHGVTAAQVGAAPAGYGFGGQGIGLSGGLLNSEAELDAALENIYGKTGNSETKLIRFAGYPDNSDYNWYGFLFKSTTNYGSLIAHSAYAKGSLISKAKYDGTWQPLEWVNPPMIAGVEYRTTERYNGKPVYVKLIDFGALPNVTNKDIAFYADETSRPISVAAQVGKVLDSLYMTIPANYGTAIWISAVNYKTIRITTGQNNSDLQARVIVKYWKSTD